MRQHASGRGVISGTIQVVIYNNATGTPVTPVVTFHGSYTPEALGFNVFQAISSVELPVGSYQVDAVGFSALDLNGNLNTGSSTGPILNDAGGALTFTGASYNFSATLSHPTTCGGCMPPPLQFSQFDAGTLELTVVPEPAFTGVLGVLLAGLTVLLRMKRSQV